MWQGNVAKKLDKIHDARTKTSRLRKVYTESKGVVHHGECANCHQRFVSVHMSRIRIRNRCVTYA